MPQQSYSTPNFHEQPQERSEKERESKNSGRELSITVVQNTGDDQNPLETPTKGGDRASDSGLRNRKGGQNRGNVPNKKGKDQGGRRGNVDLLQMAANFATAMARITSALPVFGEVASRDTSADPVEAKEALADDTDASPEDSPEKLEQKYLETHPRAQHPLFRSEVSGDVRNPLDYPPEVEKFNVRSEWRRSVLEPSFRSDVGYAVLPTGLIDEILVWMQTHWKVNPNKEERIILMQELNSTSAMLLRKHNVRPDLSYVYPVDGVQRYIEPDFSHQVNAVGAIAIDVGEPLFYASQHPIPRFYSGWPLATFICFTMLVVILSLLCASLYSSAIASFLPLAFVLPVTMILLFLIWVFGSLSVSKNRHWYYYAFSPQLRFQFGSRR